MGVGGTGYELCSNVTMAASRASLFKAGDNCKCVERAERASLLIDGEEYFRAFTRAALRARHEIVIVGWDFHSQTRLHHCSPAVPEMLGDFLNFLARRRRRLRIHILTWDCPMIFDAGRELSPHYGLGWQPHRRVTLQYDNHCPVGAAAHQKIVVIDGVVAFCGGLDLTRSRWDTSEHLEADERRINDAETAPYAAFHDTMLVVDAAAAAALHKLVSDRWARITGKPLARPNRSGDPWPEEVLPQFRGVSVAVARTSAEFAGEPAVDEVHKLYLDMIHGARRYIYLESQYFTAKELGEALAERLTQPHGPEIIAVVRLSLDGWLEAPAMGALRTVLLRKLREADRYGRFRAYYPQCDLHSKLMIADDEWLRVGSANFANRSMGLDTECDVAIEARGEPGARAAIARARDRLLGEHLGVAPSVVTEAIKARGSVAAAIDLLAGSGERTLLPLEEAAQPLSALVAVAEGVADPERPARIDRTVRDWFSESPTP